MSGKAAEELRAFGPAGTVDVDAYCNKQYVVRMASFPVVPIFGTFGKGCFGGSGQSALLDSKLVEGMGESNIQS